jgi:hypothetical protein
MKNDNNFVLFEILEDKNFSIAYINLDLRDFDRKHEFPYELVVDITPKEYRIEGEIGQPTIKEAEFLAQLERELVTELEKNVTTIYMGHLSHSVRREIIFYLQEPNSADLFMKEWIKTAKRKTDFKINIDPIWGRFDFLLKQLI